MANNSLRIDKSLSFQPQATAPADPRPGQLYVDSTDSNKLKQYITGTGWVAIGDVQGAPVTDWTAFTPTGSFTNTTYTGLYRRVGDTAEIQIKGVITSAPAAGTLTVDLPSGLSIDTAKLVWTDTVRQQLGTASILDDGTAQYFGTVQYNSPTSVEVAVDVISSVYLRYAGGATDTTPMTWAAPDTFAITFSVPIAGWSSNVTMASDPAALPGVLVIADNTGISTTANTPIQYPQTIKDVYGGYSSATGLYTCSVAGDYLITVVAVATSGNQWYVAKNGVGQQIIMDTLLNEVHSGATMVSLAVGDTVAIQGAASVTLNTPTPPQYYNYVTLSRVTGSTSIALDSITSWAEYPLTIGATTTAPTKGTTVRDKAMWRRVGDTLEMRYDFQQSGAGTAGSGTYLFPLPPGAVIDTSKLAVGTGDSRCIVGNGYISTSADVSTSGRDVQVVVQDAQTLILYYAITSSTMGVVASTQGELANTDMTYTFKAAVPIVGWDD